MGRMCGWLALKAAVACGAEFVFFPENPTPLDWPQKVIDAVKKSVNQEKRSAIVIVAEGARDTNLEHISAEAVRKTLEDAGVDSRLTILGHVQRGGSPSFYDRAHVSLFYSTTPVYSI